MNTTLKITAFTAVLAAAFGAAYGVGNAVDPVDPVSAEPAHAAHADHGADAGHRDAASRHGGEEGGGRGETRVGGLQISEGGYTLGLDIPRVKAGEETELSFTVRGEDGRPLTSYRTEHGKQLHLILASRDLAVYRHLHPKRAADGAWSVPVNLPAAGDYRVFVDFVPAVKGAKPLTLGADLAAVGEYEPEELPEPSRTATVDGYTVILDGSLRPGASGALDLKVAKDGRPVTDLQPYLGAYGHLVALRAGDLAYLHVHPGGEPGDGTTEPGPTVSFATTAPSSGSYRLFLDFKHDGKVRTAAFTVTAGAKAGEEKKDEVVQEEGDAHQH
ncbi:hypothetical protein F0L17_23995 [Streptomyces sp. TRM43335]|uniref:Secreted protein n=1 Tax=Streptomyces taklimakanensis TaxID=2569853 RepID=A0A6G2BIL3_9ACTN|nr:hypothetical protein [Streptomyces taklimakanensis]MTE22108.1 hypothetical protein [Streptomyces taklimakanensis]